MHILDLIMYFVTAGLLWFLIDIMSGGDFTQELGALKNNVTRLKEDHIRGLVGVLAMIVYTIVYIIMFVFVDYNWIDIFHSISNYTFSIQL